MMLSYLPLARNVRPLHRADDPSEPSSVCRADSGLPSVEEVGVFPEVLLGSRVFLELLEV